MKLKQTLLFFVMLITMVPLRSQAQSQNQNNKQIAINILTYNVHNSVGLDGKKHVRKIADIIRQCQADVVAIQEVDSMTNRSGQLDVLSEIGHEALHFSTFAKAIDFSGGAYGIGILSKERPLSVKRIPLPGSEERRVLLIAEYADYYFANAHLSLTEKDRLASIKMIKDEAERCEKPFFVAGDFNDTLGTPTIDLLMLDFQLLSNPKKYSFPANEPTECIDYIAVYKRNGEIPAITKYTQVIDEPVASDHRPVYAQVIVKTPKEKIFRGDPYLMNLNNDGISVLFQTNVISNCWVDYGTDTLHLNRARTLLDGQVVCDDINNRIRIENLKLGSTYRYRVCAQEILNNQGYHKDFGETAKTPFYTFRIPDKYEKDFTAILFNDLHNFTATQHKLLEYVKDIDYDFVVFNGDCLPDPANRYVTITNLHKLFDPVDAKNHPIVFIRGNHEIRNAFSSAMHYLLDYTGGQTYSAFNWGDTRFVTLDCGEDKLDSHWVYYGLNDFSQFRRDQVGFLEKELHSKSFKKATRRILLDHIPLFGKYSSEECNQLWLPLLRKAPFDLYLAAHTHQFEVIPADSIDMLCPLVIGGGPKMDEGVVMILRKKGKSLTLKAINTKGEMICTLKL
ncbi:MAG: endonuclease/exonuclease/phosphatase family protein [Bacteroidaceae bacterium]